LHIPERSISLDPNEAPPSAFMASTAVAPFWHTALLIMGVVALSIQSANEFAGPQHPINRLQTYEFTAITELVMLAWIYFGLRLKKVPLRALLGSNAGGLRSLAVDFGFAMIFWISSLMILGGIGIVWEIIQAAITHRPLFPNANQLTPDATQQQTLHTLGQLAPTNASEVLAWILLCILAGIAEELIFRGYLQRQFAAWSRGSIAVGVAGSALLFGAAHGYQGARNMVLLAVFGALFSVLSLLRRGLRPGMMAHSWQDLIAGLVLAALKAHHVV
jgi:membrane protease YdiL (CAAX protease family)